MKKTPAKTGEEDEKFSAYTPTVDLSEEDGKQSEIKPTIMPLAELPRNVRQAHDLSLSEEDDG